MEKSKIQKENGGEFLCAIMFNVENDVEPILALTNLLPGLSLWSDQRQTSAELNLKEFNWTMNEEFNWTMNDSRIGQPPEPEYARRLQHSHVVEDLRTEKGKWGTENRREVQKQPAWLQLGVCLISTQFGQLATFNWLTLGDWHKCRLRSVYTSTCYSLL